MPAKAALAAMGLCHGGVRLPLVHLTRESEAVLRTALAGAKVEVLAHAHGVGHA